LPNKSTVDLKMTMQIALSLYLIWEGDMLFEGVDW
jgi:hypothetical protein